MTDHTQSDYLRHLSETASMASFLSDAGWVELLGADYLTPDDLDTSLYVLRTFSEYTSPPGSIVKYYSLYQDTRTVLVMDSLMQFYFDLTWSWTDGPNCRLPLLVRNDSVGTDARNERFSTFEFGDNAEAYTFLSFLEQNKAILCPGFYRSRGGRHIPGFQTNTLKDLRSFNAICIDIDNYVATSPVDAARFAEAFGRIPDELRPTYISLSGNGVHLWYIFEPIQTFSEKNPKRRKIRALKEGLYNYFGALFDGLMLKIDPNSIPINQPARAPGSVTKYGDLVRCFRPADTGFKPSSLCAMDLSDFMCTQNLVYFDKSLRLTDDDVFWKSREQLSAEADERALAKASSRATVTDKQVSYAKDLLEAEVISEQDFLDLCAGSRAEASKIISGAEARMSAKRAGWQMPEKSSLPEGVVPHRLISGSTGGVYAKLLEVVKSRGEDGKWLVPAGNREVCLYMIAGIANMMSMPMVSKSQLERDFRDLLYTEWGTKTSPPLTISDIKKATTGFKASNWRSRKSIVKTLGFDPFDEPQKRNGRSREEHLKEYLPAKRASTMSDKSREKIAAHLVNNPAATKSETSEAVGLCWATVDRYWEEVHAALGLGVATRSARQVEILAEALKEKPHMTKKAASQICGLSYPTVRKYWDEALLLASNDL